MSDAPPPIKRYEGKDIDVTWDSRLCIHVGECGRAANELFVGGRDPWCQPDLCSNDDVVDVVGRCPTGALVYISKKDTPAEKPAAENTVHIANNGPLYLRGDLQIDGAADDMEGVKMRAALCRCGLSKQKPFCDNSHEGAFVDRGAVGQRGEGFTEPGGVLQIRRAKNGPLLVSGKVSIYNGAGQLAWQGEKVALCRCGQSANKPFCDGAHKPAGFEAD